MANLNPGVNQPPRSYQPGYLLSLVVREFSGFESRTLAADQAELTTPNGLTFIVRERVEKRFMAHTVIAEFFFPLKDTPPGEAEIQFSHTGAFTRTGLRGQVKRGGPDATEVEQRLTTNEAFVQTILPLDFQYFQLWQDADGWHALTGQVGGAWVVMALPPTRRYVPLGRDQVAALVATFEQLQTLFDS